MENKIEMEQNSAHFKEVKFIKINQRSELPIFAKEVDFHGEEFLWNSYSAEGNRGPAVEFKRKINLESTTSDTMGMNIDKDKSINSIIFENSSAKSPDPLGPSLLRLSKRGNSENIKKNSKGAHIDRAIVLNPDRKEKWPAGGEFTSAYIETGSPTAPFKGVAVTTTISAYAGVITTTRSFTRYIKTVKITETETYDVYDLTTTVKTTVEVTKTLKNRVVETSFITVEALPPQSISSSNSSRAISTSPDSVMTASTLSTSTIGSVTRATSSILNIVPNRERESKLKEVDNRRTTNSRTRNGFFHQKLLAQKNLRIEKREELNSTKEADDIEHRRKVLKILDFICYCIMYNCLFMILYIEVTNLIDTHYYPGLF